MHIIPFNGRSHSGTYDLNLLYNDGKTYIMDNHLAAGWCWLQKIDTNKQYNLLHIDRHYDLLDSQTDLWIEALRTQNIDLKTISIPKLTALQYVHPDMGEEPFTLFRWDNYLTIFNKLYPDTLDSCLFATQKDGDLIDDLEIDEVDSWDLQCELSYWLNERGKAKWIVNLDIDYFFSDYGDEHYFQLFSDEFVIRIADEIKKSMNNIEVLTIALSPEMCGGWDKAERVAKLITSHLNAQWID